MLIFILPNHCRISRIPHVYLNDSMLTFVQKHSYLGVVLNYLGNDMDDIKRQMRCFYASANSLIRIFYNCSEKVKICLFKAYCSVLYCSHLWSTYTQKCISDVKVSYNNAFRILLGIRQRLSISETFVGNCIMTFQCKLRLARSKFYLRLVYSENSLIEAGLSWNVMRDSLFWRKILTDCF